MSIKTRSGEPLDKLASDVHRLAVLLAAGVPANTAWGYLDSEPGGAVAAVAESTAAGTPVPAAIASAADLVGQPDRAAWAALAAGWAVATEAGAALAPTLLRLATTLRSLAQMERDVGVALAGPAATRKLVLWLPAVGVLFGLGFGFDPLGTLLTTMPGIACLATGSALLVLASAWTARLVRAALPTGKSPGLDLELLAIAVSGSGSVERAVAIVVEHAGLQPGAPALRVLELSSRAGVPAAELLRAEADQQRREHLAALQTRVARLGVTLLVPLGVCVLPAFLALGVLPLMISVLSGTVGGL